MSKTIRHRLRYAVRVYHFPPFWYVSSRFARSEDAVAYARECERALHCPAKVIDTYTRRQRRDAQRSV